MKKETRDLVEATILAILYILTYLPILLIIAGMMRRE